MRSTIVRTDDDYDMVASVAVLRHGGADPTMRLGGSVAWRALRTDAGTATLRFERVTSGVRVTAWGEGAEPALDAAPAMLGCEDDARSYRPRHPLLRELHRRFIGVRLPRTRTIFDHLIPSVLEQKVTGAEAFASYRALVLRHGERAPGPAGLRVHVQPQTIAALAYHELHPLGIERRRSDTLRRACARPFRMNEAAAMSPEDARARLRAVPGIGAWTAAEVTRSSHGDADAVSVGDYHLPNVVAWALSGEPRANDERMLELLEPERPHRGRAIRLLELAGVTAPAFGPRHRLRSIVEI